MLRLLPPFRLAVGWTLLIMVALTIPGKSIPDSHIFQLDKLIHAGLFLVLTLLWLAALSEGHIGRGLTILAAMIVFAIFTEFYQQIMPIGRSADLLDSVADAIGSIVAFLIWLDARTRLERWRQRSVDNL
ncbi:MAG: VanZ family protein [Bacteroidetes bacterium]|nr:VanZ family protein [Bacteroidota bacterium]